MTTEFYSHPIDAAVVIVVGGDFIGVWTRVFLYFFSQLFKILREKKKLLIQQNGSICLKLLDVSNITVIYIAWKRN